MTDIHVHDFREVWASEYWPGNFMGDSDWVVSNKCRCGLGLMDWWALVGFNEYEEVA